MMQMFIIFTMCLFINWCGASMDLLSSQNHLQIISVPEINNKGSFKNVKDGEFINDVKSMVAVEREPNERQGRHMCKYTNINREEKPFLKIIYIVTIKMLMMIEEKIFFRQEKKEEIKETYEIFISIIDRLVID